MNENFNKGYNEMLPLQGYISTNNYYNEPIKSIGYEAQKYLNAQNQPQNTQNNFGQTSNMTSNNFGMKWTPSSYNPNGFGNGRANAFNNGNFLDNSWIYSGNKQNNRYNNGFTYDNIAPLMPPVMSFAKNFFDSKDNMKINGGQYYPGTDKYFHAKANCQSGQNNTFSLNSFPLLETLFLDYGRELYDIPRKTWKKPEKFEDFVIDSQKDINADLYGLQKGLEHPFTDCRILLDDLRTDKINKPY